MRNIGKTLKAYQELEKYLAEHPSTHNKVIFTNSKEIQQLLTQYHPEIEVKALSFKEARG